MATHSSILPGKAHGWKSLVGCSPWGREESDTTKRLHFHFSLSCIGEGNGNPLQCSCLENPRDGGAWWAARYGVAQSRIRLKRLSSSSSSSSSQNVSIVTIREYLKCTVHRVRKMVSPKMLWAVITIVNHRVQLIPEFSGNSGFTFEVKSVHFSKPQLSRLWHGHYLR